MTKRFWLLPLLLPILLCLSVMGQAAQDVRPLVSGQTIEHEIAGAESHTYQLTLQAGQFVRFRLEQRTIDAALILTAPDGKQMVEMNLTGAGEQESLSMEAAIAGSYWFTMRSRGAAG